MNKRLLGGLWVGLGYMLSPLSWWNDLFFNLPIAYRFGWVCSLAHSEWLLAGTVVGYWLSNVLGIIMMQLGFGDLVYTSNQQRNWAKDIFVGVISSTAYTVLIVSLIKFQLMDIATIFPLIEGLS